MEYFDFVLPQNVHLQDTKLTSVLHFNSRSAVYKSDSISCLLSQFSFRFDVIMISETWFQHSYDVVGLDGYTSFYINRQNRRGGGVALYTKNNCHYELMPEFTFISLDCEMLTVKDKKRVLSVIYRPPSGSIENFFSCFGKLLEYCSFNNLHFVCGGDFNINILDDNKHVHDLNSLLLSSGFANLITTATRVTQSTSSALDLLITNIETSVHTAGTISNDISDHCPVFIVYALENTIKQNTDLITYQHISNEALDLFSLAVSTHSWDSVLRKTNVNEAYNEFLEAFVRIYTAHFPFKQVRKSKKIRKPWIMSEHIKMIKNKNRLYHAFLHSRSEIKLKEFKTERNRLNKILRQAKIDYYQCLFSEISRKRPDAVWKVINSVLGRQTKSNVPKSISYKNCELSGKALADHFNTHFVNAGVTHTHDSEVRYSLSKCVTETIFMEPTDEHEVFTIIKNLSNSKALDIDNLQIKPIKYVLDYFPFIHSLVHIFNLAIESATFPDGMKRARVSVLFKNGDINNVSNYRPISVLPIFSKVLEKIIAARLTKFLDKHNVITNSQFGFRKGRSTEAALLSLKESIVQSIDSQKFALGLFIDFSKAFDCLSHDILAYKLSMYGVRGHPLALMKSYLANRTQCVCIDNILSSFVTLKNGVPQGSVLGPLLFNLYINDLVNIDPTVDFFIYADDSTILFNGKDANQLIIRCNAFLVKLSDWSLLNVIRINPTKTKAILFRARNKPFQLEYSITYSGQNIELVNEHKILGVIFSCHLSWDAHFNNLRNKFSAVAGVLSRCRAFMPIKAKLQIYHALFTSQFNYCCLVWATTTGTNINKIITLQKALLRHIANIEPRSTTKTLSQKYQIIWVDRYYEYRVLQVFYFAKKQYSDFLTSIASLQHHEIPVHLRNPEPWYVPRFRTEYKLQSIKHNLPKILNNHVNATNLSRKELKMYFVNM